MSNSASFADLKKRGRGRPATPILPELAEALKGRETYSQIASRLNLTAPQVKYAAKRLGIKRKKRYAVGTRCSERSKQILAALCRGDMSGSTISRLFNVKRQWVSAIARKHGISQRARKRERIEKFVTPFLMDLISHCVRCGASTKQGPFCHSCGDRWHAARTVKIRLRLWKKKHSRQDLRSALWLIRKSKLTPEEVAKA